MTTNRLVFSSLPTRTIAQGQPFSSAAVTTPQEEGYHSQCLQILSRGVNCVQYEGPGHPTVRRQQNTGFISDWWTVATPVVDYLSTRSDIDMSKLALAGMSFGGCLTPIAASHDDRYSAVIAIDGLLSLQQEALEEQFPPKTISLFNSSNVTGFNEVMNDIQANSTYPSSLRWIIGYGLWAFDTLSHSTGSLASARSQ